MGWNRLRQNSFVNFRLTHFASTLDGGLRNQDPKLYVSNRMENVAHPERGITYVACYFALWTLMLGLLWAFTSFNLSEAISALVVLGLVFPALSWLCTRSQSSLPIAVRNANLESLLLILYLLAVVWVIVFGFERVARISAEPLHSVVLLIVKLVVFVLIPAGLIAKVGHYSFRDMMPTSLKPRALLPALWMSLAVLLMQAFLGRGLRDIRGAHQSASALMFAAPLCFVWLMLEVGVVEEFFFRVLLQERLARGVHSQWGGLVSASLLFGLVHAPGFYLRPAATQEALGAHPSLLLAIGYSVVLTSLAGLFLGVLWMRTKNFVVIVIVHAAGDLLPNLLPWTHSFHLVR